MSLRTTIEQIQVRDSELLAIAADRDEFVTKWRSDLEQLYAKMQTLLKDLEEEQALNLSVTMKQLKENTLGEYSVPELRIQIGSRRVIASPIARLTIGGTGRVDLYRHDRPAEYDRIMIVRGVSKKGNAPWAIEMKSADDMSPIGRMAMATNSIVSGLINRGTRTFNTLDKVALENALDYLLQID